MTVRDLAPLAVAVPLLVAAILPVLSHLGCKGKSVDVISCLTALATLALNIILLVQCSSAPFVYWFGGWVPGASFPVGIALLVEPVAAGTAVLAALLTLAGLLFSAKYFEDYETFFHVLLLVFLAAMTGFCFAGDLFNQFVFFELMGVAAYALTGYKVEDTGPLEGGLNFAVINSMGAISILMGIGLVYGVTGSLTMTEVGKRLATREPDVLVLAALVLFLSGYFVKGAILPFHFWLPDAHAVAPTAASVLFSGVMVETAVVGGFRTMRWVFTPALAAQDEGIRSVIICLGAATALLGGFMALLQRHLKRLLAFSTIGHVGTMVASLAFLTKDALAGCFVYICGHGLVKGALFCCAGMILHRKGSVDELDLHGRCKDLYICGAVFFLSAAGLAGLPPFATFTGKSLMDEGASRVGCHWFAWVAALATALTVAAVLRAGARMFLGLGGPDPLTESALVSGSVEGRETTPGPTPITMWGAAAVLALTAFAAGAWPAVSRVADAAASLYLEPTGVQALMGHGLPQRLPAGEPFHLEAKSVAVALATAAVAVLVAAGYLLPKNKAIFGKAVPLATPFRTVHSGHVGDYATWFLIGMAVLLLVLVYQLG